MLDSKFLKTIWLHNIRYYNFCHLAAIHRASLGSRKLYFNLLYILILFYFDSQKLLLLFFGICRKTFFFFLRIKIKQKDSRQKVVLQLIKSQPTLPDYRQFGSLSVPIQRWSFLFPVAFVVSPYYGLINLHKSTVSSTLDKSKDSLSFSLCVFG